jgi:hypothetical protein
MPNAETIRDGRAAASCGAAVCGPARASQRHRRIDVYRRGCFVFEAKQGVNAPAPGAAQRPRAGASW